MACYWVGIFVALMLHDEHGKVVSGSLHGAMEAQINSMRYPESMVYG